MRAVAEGLGSQTLTVQMYSKVRVKLRRLKSGTVVVSGTTSPKLGGRILWLRSNAVRRARAPRPATAASSSASSLPGPVATRPSSSPAAIAPSVPPRTLESSDEPSLGLAAVATAAALALPAVASAHTTVYTTTAKKFEDGVLSDSRATWSSTTATRWS